MTLVVNWRFNYQVSNYPPPHHCRLFGSYEALDGGRLSEALEDFTGGVSDSIDLVSLGVASYAEAREQLFVRLEKEMDRNSMMGASIPVSLQS